MTNGINELCLQPSSETVEISGQFLRKDEKVLVEIGGRFHVVEAGELEKSLPALEGRDKANKKMTHILAKQHSKSSPSSSRPTSDVSLFAAAKV